MLFLVGSNAASCHPIVWNRIRSRRRVPDRRRPAADPDRRARRPAPAGPPRHRPSAAERDAARARARRAARSHVPGAPHARRRGRADDRRGVDARARRRGLRRAGARTSSPPRGGSARPSGRWRCGRWGSTSPPSARSRTARSSTSAWPPGTSGGRGRGRCRLTGQPNAMGGRETGGLAALLPGYRKVANAEDRAEMRRFWGSPGIAPEPGLASTELVDALEDGRVKVLWIVATNPVVSQPDAGRFAAALRRAELVVVPGRLLPDRDRRAGARAAARRRLAGEGRDDDELRAAGVAWWRAPSTRPARRCRTGRSSRAWGGRSGFREAFAWRTAAQVHAEYVRTTEGRLCDQMGISHARLRRDGPLQWPCPSPEHPGTERLYGARRFSIAGRPRAARRRRRTPRRPIPSSPDFPLVLTTGRVAQQWHTMTRTGQVAVAAGGRAASVRRAAPGGRRGAGGRRARAGAFPARVRGPAAAGDRRACRRGCAFAPFHWGALHAEPGAGAVNNVTARDVDPVSLQPELKACAVRVEPVGVPVGAGRPGPAAGDRRRRDGRDGGRRRGARARSGLADHGGRARAGRALQPRAALAGARG